MEGFLQSLKRRNPDVQEYGCTLVGRQAKYWGKGIKWWQRPENEQLYWKGDSFPCHSEKHLSLKTAVKKTDKAREREFKRILGAI